ncbi:hypothetical protein GTA08_BOTSDO05261 [Botryosphaeria dothidea]|uniref:Uncharacterized protein n=1 Tax=Botryosphaeria dothidea TaxID=55169 RepID=A0A8H4IU39_9PEZI|nr:hypothetical protein GTA08_BOTSDO05261 [Botryosphaeria dothidea]
MGLLRTVTASFSFKDFTVSATAWLTLSFRPLFLFVFNSIFPIMFRPGKRVASSTATNNTAAGGPSSTAMDVMDVAAPAAAGPRPRSARQRKPKPQGPWPRDAGGQ